MRGPDPRVWLVLVLSTITAVALYWEVFERPEALGYGDYHEYHHLWEAGRVAIERHGELPLWNPHHCGGITQLANPQSMALHPLILLAPLVGGTLSLKIFLVLHAALGFAGAWFFARREESLSILSSTVAAAVWAGCGYLVWHCGTGHANFIAFYLIPWVLLTWRAALRDIRNAAWLALVMTSIVFAGGVYVFPFAVVLLAYDGASRMARATGEPRAARARKLLVAGLVATGLTALLGAYRLLPILDYLSQYPRVEGLDDSLSVLEILEALTDGHRPWPPRVVEGHPYAYVEYAAYVGWAVVLLFAAGLPVLVKRKPEYVVGALFFGVLSAGAFSDLSPWALLHRLPIFDSLKVPSRFSILLVLYAALGAGAVLDHLREVTSSRPKLPVPRIVGLALIGCLAAFCVGDVFAHHVRVLDGKWVSDEVPPDSSRRFFIAEVPPPYQGEDRFPPSPALPAHNVGTGYCYSGLEFGGARGLWPGEGPQVRLRDEGEVTAWGRTSRAAWAEVRMPLGGRVLFNQTFDPGWQAHGGTRAIDEGRLAVDVPPGASRVDVRYAPTVALPGAWLSALGLVAAVLLLAFATPGRLRRVTHARTMVVSLACVGAVGLAYGSVLARADRGGAPGATITASGWNEQTLNDWYSPEHVTDGQIGTEWHAPNDVGPGGAWLQIELRPPRVLRTVRILNGRNSPYFDRASREVRVDAMRGGRVVATRIIEFEDAPRSLVWRDAELEPAWTDAIRLTPVGAYGHGASIAEVEWF